MKFSWFIKGAILFAGFIALVAFVVMALWNALIPDLFGGPKVSFLQAAGLLLLAKILFGFSSGGHFKGKWKSNWNHKWKSMSQEEKQQFREMYKRRCKPDYTPFEKDESKETDTF